MRDILKKIARRIFQLLILPAVAFYWLGRLAGKDSVFFQMLVQLLSLIPGKLGSYTRVAFLSMVCDDISEEIVVGFLTLFSHEDTSIESGVYIGPQCNIGKCKIGLDTLIGSGVHILSGNKQHGFDDISKPIQKQRGCFAKIEIGMDCWIGNGSIVMASVAPHTIIAAGAIVSKPIEEGMGIYAGNPAKRIGERGSKTNPKSCFIKESETK